MVVIGNQTLLHAKQVAYPSPTVEISPDAFAADFPYLFSFLCFVFAYLK